MTNYDSINFYPAAPVANVEVQSPNNNSKSFLIKMQIDSGADISCVPKYIIEQVSDYYYSSITATDYKGNVYEEKTCFVKLVILDRLSETIEVLVIENSVGLIGRDILNNFGTILNGPMGKWSFK